MKPVSLVIAVVVAVLLGMPPVVGLFTEDRLAARTLAIEEQTDNGYQLEIIEFDGGWFNSSARINASLNEELIEQIAAAAISDDNPSSVLMGAVVRSLLTRSLPLAIDFGHGPLTFANGLQFGLVSTTIRPDPESDGMADILEALDVEYLFELRTLTKLDGSSTFEAEVPPIDVDFPAGQVAFSGFMSDGNFDFRQRHLAGSGVINSIQVDAGATGVINIEDVSLQTDMTGITPGMWLGDAMAEIGAVSSNGVGPGGPFNLTVARAGASFDTTLDEDTELVTIEGKYYLDSLFSNSATGDEDLRLTDVNFDFTMRDFSMQALQEYYDYSRQIVVSPETAPPIFPGIENIVYLTLVSSPSIAIGPLNFLWDDQPFEAQVLLSINGSEVPERDAYNMFDLPLLIRAITVEGSTAMSNDIAQLLATEAAQYQIRSNAAAAGNQIAEQDVHAMAQSQSLGMLYALVAQGLLAQTEEGYSSELLFVNGELTVNETIVPLGLLR
jgi:uncharacterized protein YdgA (DUF945 family)